MGFYIAGKIVFLFKMARSIIDIKEFCQTLQKVGISLTTWFLRDRWHWLFFTFIVSFPTKPAVHLVDYFITCKFHADTNCVHKLGKMIYSIYIYIIYNCFIVNVMNCSFICEFITVFQDISERIWHWFVTGNVMYICNHLRDSNVIALMPNTM